ncbi:hypothetical protein C0966_10190 [Bacillus methanolicus]|nr:hypothetical protein [Bacillus methanolicus]
MLISDKHPIVFKRMIKNMEKRTIFFAEAWEQYTVTNERKVITMRFSEKGMSASLGENQILGVDFHDFIQKEQNENMFELASEFGLSIRNVRKLKKRLERS